MKIPGNAKPPSVNIFVSRIDMTQRNCPSTYFCFNSSTIALPMASPTFM